MFEPRYIEHRGVRILRLQVSGLSSSEVVSAAEHIQRLIAAEPLRSVRTLTILGSWLTAEGAEAMKRCALADRPYVRAGAVVAPVFWRVVATKLRALGREDLRFFTDEESALDWLATQ